MIRTNDDDFAHLPATYRDADRDLESYYRWSAPDPDLLGDLDAYGIYQLIRVEPTRRLSELITSYYSDLGAWNRRFRTFALATGLFDVEGSSIRRSETRRAYWIRRINNFVDLYITCYVRLLVGSALGIIGADNIVDPNQEYEHTPDAIDMFLDWVEDGLRSEIKRAARSGSQ